MPAAVGALVLVLFLLLPRYVDHIVRRVGAWAAPHVSDRDGGQRPRHRATGVASRLADPRRVGYLGFDITVLFACFAAAGHVPPLAPVVLAYQIGYLANFIPVPGGIAVLDGCMIGMLVLYGLGRTVATAATLTYHAISPWVRAIWARSRSSCCRRSSAGRSSCATRVRNFARGPSDLKPGPRPAAKGNLGRQIFSRGRSIRQLRSPPFERDDPHRQCERDLIERLGELGDRHEVVA